MAGNARPELGNVLFGARGYLTIGDVPMGYGIDARLSENIAYEGLRTLGYMYIQEWVPQSYDCSASFSRVYLAPNTSSTTPLAPGSPFGALNDITMAGTTGTLWPQHGQSELDFKQNIFKTITGGPGGTGGEGLTLTIDDTLNGNNRIFKMTGCVIAARDIAIRAGQTSLEDVVVLGTILLQGKEAL